MTTVTGLLNQIHNDEIVLPGIQRDFVWDEDHIARLLDSLLRGYPIGIILMWETYNDIQYRPFARDYFADTPFVYKDNASRKRVKLVLDGQQRLQSLYIALYGTFSTKPLYLDLLSGGPLDDLSDDRYLFRFLKPADAAAKNSRLPGACHWVKVSDLLTWSGLERAAYRKHIREAHSLSDSDMLGIETTMTALDDALTHDGSLLSVATVDENKAPDSQMRQSEADVLEIFFRINREGTPLSRSDLIFSLLKLNWREAAELLPDFLRRLNDGNSLDLTTDFVVRCLFVVSDLGGKLDLDLLRQKPNIAKLQENFSDCCEAIEATVDFVRNECRCENSAVIGSSNVLIPFVYYLYHAPQHQIPNAFLAAARRGFYLLALSRPFTRYSESRVGTFVKSELRPLCSAGDLGFPVARTIESIRRWERVDSHVRLAEANPRLTLHLVQGLSPGKVQYAGNAPEIDHIFPRSVLHDKGYPEEDIDTVANFWILALNKNRNKSSKAPSQYFADVDQGTLDRAAIDPSLLQYSHYRRFCRRRLEALVERLTKRVGLTASEVELLSSGGVGPLEEEQ